MAFSRASSACVERTSATTAARTARRVDEASPRATRVQQASMSALSQVGHQLFPSYNGCQSLNSADNMVRF